MKIRTRMLSLVVAIVSIFQLSLFPISASNSTSNSSEILLQEIDEENQTATYAFSRGETVIYVKTTNNFTYVSQVSSSGTVQFSYTTDEGQTVFESEIYNIDEIYPQFSMLSHGDNNEYSSLNDYIIENIENFTRGTTYSFNPEPAISPWGFSIPGLAIRDVFGTEYSNEVIDGTNKSYNNQTYTLTCYETKVIDSASPQIVLFSAGTAASSVITWLLAAIIFHQPLALGALIVDYVLNTIALNIINGIEYLAEDYEAGKTGAECTITRFVMVDGYSNVQAASSWSRSMAFVKTPDGWVNDYEFYNDFKNINFDSPENLMNTAFDIFTSSVLS